MFRSKTKTDIEEKMYDPVKWILLVQDSFLWAPSQTQQLNFEYDVGGKCSDSLRGYQL
jgi:hypothetical protein